MAEPLIQETTLTPIEGGGFAVELHISEAPADAEDAAFVLKLYVEIPRPQTDQLSHIQRQALLVGSQVLRNLIND